MKKWIMLLLMCVLFLSSTSLAEEKIDIDLTELNSLELNELQSDVEKALRTYHETISHTRDEVLKSTKMATESYFAEQGIEISWAWIDYSYSRDWDFYTMTTYIDYTDTHNIKQKPGVYAEVFHEGSQYTVYYLLIGTEEVIDQRDELPSTKWSSQPQSIINAATGIDLSTVSSVDLVKLQDEIKREYVENHDPDSTINDLVFSLTDQEIGEHFSRENIEVSWPWFDYTFTRDWDFYTMTTYIAYRDMNGKQQNKDVYAEAYPFSGQYALCYLKVGDEVFIDERDQLPDKLKSVINPVPSDTPTP